MDVANQSGQLRKVHANAIIIGFTGSVSSGCSEFAKWLRDEKGYEFYALSSPIYAIANEQLEKGEITEITQEILQDIGNDLRKKHGQKILARIALYELDERYKKEPFDKIVIDGVRNLGEVKLFREYPRFYLLSIHAEKESRRQRWQKKNQDKSYTDFKNIDKRDEEENLWHGQQVKQCCDESDIAINNENVDEKQINLENPIDKNRYCEEKLSKYLELIENGPQMKYRPNMNEKLMTLAYLESISSSCSQRKVGAVIATEQGDVLSTGFNHVPEGEEPCLTAYRGCYRKHLRKEESKKIKFCPQCGEKIVRSGKSGSDIEFDYKCVNKECEALVFESFTIGGKKSIGKGLDVCRALHAEENAIVNLAKSGKAGAKDSVLYSTTFPCTLCANKIAQCKMSKVIYGEPYTMEDAEKLLHKQNINTERFEGVKSSAFFRLYGATLEVLK